MPSAAPEILALVPAARATDGGPAAAMVVTVIEGLSAATSPAEVITPVSAAAAAAAAAPLVAIAAPTVNAKVYMTLTATAMARNLEQALYKWP